MCLRGWRSWPKTVAHLRAVHDVAARLVAWAAERGLPVDAEAVLFGAATHDIGKALHPAELSGPGSEHEAAGRDLLLLTTVGHGADERLAYQMGYPVAPVVQK
ncbi:hypothetical protein ABH920_008084 [Catenulispora sp. EB89]